MNNSGVLVKKKIIYPLIEYCVVIIIMYISKECNNNNKKKTFDNMYQIEFSWK